MKTILHRLFARQPDFVIGNPKAPYLRRWWLIPRNRYFNVYLHQILRSDDDRALHDHPWWNCSIILNGGYYEVMPDEWNPLGQVAWRRRGQIIFRRATARHRLALLTENTLFDPINERWLPRELPCWSLFITGPKVREWGFWCPKGFKHWRDFVSQNNSGEIGPGCGD